MITKAEITHVKSLSDKRSRDEHNEFIAEGAKLVSELLDSNLTVRVVYATDKGLEQIGRRESDTIVRVADKEMERISQFKTPSSVVAVVRKPQQQGGVPSKDKLVIALDTVQDPGNLGTIIRLADWFGVDEIVCSVDSADCYSPKVVQATMGAILRVRVHYTDLCGYLKAASKTGVNIYGTFLEGDNIYKEQLSAGGVIVMGNEGNGISSQVGACVTHKLYIPPFPPTAEPTSESLNVAIATAVICSEFRRR